MQIAQIDYFIVRFLFIFKIARCSRHGCSLINNAIICLYKPYGHMDHFSKTLGVFMVLLWSCVMHIFMYILRLTNVPVLFLSFILQTVQCRIRIFTKFAKNLFLHMSALFVRVIKVKKIKWKKFCLKHVHEYVNCICIKNCIKFSVKQNFPNLKSNWIHIAYIVWKRAMWISWHFIDRDLIA